MARFSRPTSATDTRRLCLFSPSSGPISAGKRDDAQITGQVVVHRLGTTFVRRAPAGGTAFERGEHGVLRCYLAGCRCARCTGAFRKYHRLRYAERQVLTSGSVNRRVSAHRTAERLMELRAWGWTWAKLEAATEFRSQTLMRVARTPGGRCWSLVERAVLQIEP
jgi:hypothetical protein